jgi:N6-L-threonylcarbamoyladenine synthase
MAFLPQVMDTLWTQSGYGPKDIDGIGVTSGPGLVGGLLVGTLFAKGMACRWNIPLWPIHHLEAHALMVRMTQNVSFPYGLLLLSGGHCLMAVVHGVHQYQVLGQTYDDAAGECIDKVARCLGGPYPGGPFVESMAVKGDPFAMNLPIPLYKERSCNFSFSGLKTACAQWIQKEMQKTGHLEDRFTYDFCASFQRAVAESLCQRLGYAMEKTGQKVWVVSGGVGANAYFREKITTLCQNHGGIMIAPPPDQCTDNGAMIAWATYEHHRAGQVPNRYACVHPHWPLETLAFSGPMTKIQ